MFKGGMMGKYLRLFIVSSVYFQFISASNPQLPKASDFARQDNVKPLSNSKAIYWGDKKEDEMLKKQFILNNRAKRQSMDRLPVGLPKARLTHGSIITSKLNNWCQEGSDDSYDGDVEDVIGNQQRESDRPSLNLFKGSYPGEQLDIEEFDS